MPIRPIWYNICNRSKIAIVHKENPAGRAITKLLTAFELKPDHCEVFRPTEVFLHITNYTLGIQVPSQKVIGNTVM